IKRFSRMRPVSSPVPNVGFSVLALRLRNVLRRSSPSNRGRLSLSTLDGLPDENLGRSVPKERPLLLSRWWEPNLGRSSVRSRSPENWLRPRSPNRRPPAPASRHLGELPKGLSDLEEKDGLPSGERRCERELLSSR